MKNWELSVQWTADRIRQERTGGSQHPYTLHTAEALQTELANQQGLMPGPAAEEATRKEHQAATTTYRTFISHIPRAQRSGMEWKRVKEHFMYPSSVLYKYKHSSQSQKGDRNDVLIKHKPCAIPQFGTLHSSAHIKKKQKKTKSKTKKNPKNP